ncbi:MAG: TIGR00366 family protein [Natrialbaceae archaeon]|nr:TIGR00366 family protein [Natrialbaceae archaeon]
MIIIPLLLPAEGKRVSRREASTGNFLTDGGRKSPEPRPVPDGGTTSRFAFIPGPKSGETRLKTILLDSRLVGSGVGLALLAYIVLADVVIEINTIITILLAIGLLLNMRLRVYTNFLRNAWGPAGQWLIQFQFYGGIMGILIWSGLIDQIAGILLRSTTPTTFYAAVTFVSAIINLLVPSAGGQWIVTGDVLITSANNVGVAHNWTVMAFVLGDQLTNVVHPFVLIPVFAIAGVSFKHLGGYLVIAFGIFLSISMTSALLFGIFL